MLYDVKSLLQRRSFAWQTLVTIVMTQQVNSNLDRDRVAVSLDLHPANI